VTGRAELFLFIVTRDRARSADLDVTGPEITGSNGWVALEVAAQVPEDAELIRFGLTLTGRGGVALRNVVVAGVHAHAWVPVFPRPGTEWRRVRGRRNSGPGY
jgi:hypothetical protein